MKARIAISRIDGEDEASSTLLSECEQHAQDVRRRAWDYFQRRGAVAGNDWEDWLRAERELVWKPHAEMFVSVHDIVLRAAVPGFGPRSIRVTASPWLILIQGSEPHHHDGLEARLHFCEFGERLFRMFELPARIVPNTVSATLDKGILEIVAAIARKRKAVQADLSEAPARGISEAAA